MSDQVTVKKPEILTALELLADLSSKATVLSENLENSFARVLRPTPPTSPITNPVARATAIGQEMQAIVEKLETVNSRLVSILDRVEL